MLSPSTHILHLTSEKTRKYNDVINELNELNRKNDALKRFNQTMFETYEEIDTLAHKIDTIAKIWGVVRILVVYVRL